MHVIQRYRRAQRRARLLFDPFTREHCPSCETPCCRKPNPVRPVDIILVEELGYALPRREDGADPAAVRAAALLDARLGVPEDTREMCDFLGAGGCAFPTDLRPYGCAAFICEPMRRLLLPGELTEVEAAVAELTAAHEALMGELQT
jgi:hypothetical protein